MPGKRIICTELWQSETVARLTELERFFFVGMIVHADDQGRLRASPALLRSKLNAFDEEMTLSVIRQRLQAIAEIGSIFLYESEGIEYAQIINWWQYQKPQWAYPSKYPAPDGWVERQRYRKDNKVVTKNWDKNQPAGFIEGGDSQDGYAKDEAKEGVNGASSLPKPLPKDLPKPLDCGHNVNNKDNNYHEDDESRMRACEDSGPDPPLDQKWGQIMTLYHENINISESPIIYEAMGQPEYRNLPLPWWQEAITIAAANNSRRWNYIKRVLDRSIEAGVSPDTLGPPNHKKGKNHGQRRPTTGKPGAIAAAQARQKAQAAVPLD